MTETLKNIIECYQKGKLNTPNIQVIDRIFSDEVINLPDDELLNLTFSRAFFEKSRLTTIRFCNGSFGSSFFKDCFLENCVFLNIHFQEMECLKCIFKDCLFVDSEISETIFESCTFSKGSLDDSEFQSYHFINKVFRDITFSFGTLIDSRFSDSKKSIEFKGEVYFNNIFDQIDKFHID